MVDVSLDVAIPVTGSRLACQEKLPEKGPHVNDETAMVPSRARLNSSNDRRVRT